MLEVFASTPCFLFSLIRQNHLVQNHDGCFTFLAYYVCYKLRKKILSTSGPGVVTSEFKICVRPVYQAIVSLVKKPSLPLSLSEGEHANYSESQCFALPVENSLSA